MKIKFTSGKQVIIEIPWVNISNIHSIHAHTQSHTSSAKSWSSMSRETNSTNNTNILNSNMAAKKTHKSQIYAIFTRIQLLMIAGIYSFLFTDLHLGIFTHRHFSLFYLCLIQSNSQPIYSRVKSITVKTFFIIFGICCRTSTFQRYELKIGDDITQD